VNSGYSRRERRLVRTVLVWRHVGRKSRRMIWRWVHCIVVVWKGVLRGCICGTLSPRMCNVRYGAIVLTSSERHAGLEETLTWIPNLRLRRDRRCIAPRSSTPRTCLKQWRLSYVAMRTCRILRTEDPNIITQRIMQERKHVEQRYP
jgi:hypothetical protein